MPTPLNNAISQAVMNYGKRENGTNKANGYFGPLKRPDGSVSTELSAGMNINGKQTLVPLLVPSLNSDEVNYLLTNKPDPKNIPQSILMKAGDFARGRMQEGKDPFAGNEEVPYGMKLSGEGKSPEWQASQFLSARGGINAGLPVFEPTVSNSPARLQLMDAISRSGQAGYPVPHFIGTTNEPSGDRAVSMDLDSLVNALQAQEEAAIKSGDKATLAQIQKEKAYWANEAAQGMTNAEWGEADPQLNSSSIDIPEIVQNLKEYDLQSILSSLKPKQFGGYEIPPPR